MSLRWKLNRLRAMGAREVLHRTASSLRGNAERVGIGRARVPAASTERHGRVWSDMPPTDFDAQPYTDAADRILAGRYSVFSQRDIQLGFPPLWNRDPKTGTVAPLEFGKTLNYRDERLVGDIKYLWEINRHLELVTLAQAWHLTRDARYANACRELVASWIGQCPYPQGVNWTSSLEAGIRLVNWAFTWHLIGSDDSPVFAGGDGRTFKDQWLTAIYRQCHFIRGHLSRFSSANNHLLGELMGLFVGATVWPRWPESATWSRQALAEFEQQALLQNASDGVNREQSAWYHHEVADMMLLTALVARANGSEVQPLFWKRLEAMLEFVAAIMDVEDNVPALGDADDAVIVRFTPRQDFSVYRSLLATGAVLFERADFKARARSLDDKTRWLLGDESAARFESLGAPAKPGPARRAFPEGGYFVLGGDFESPEEVRIVADAGPLGYLSIAAHGHADALSFSLSAGGKPILIDPGTYAYHTDQKWRAYFRGTSAHNTLRIDNTDQSVAGGNFLWLAHARAHVERVSVCEDEQRLVATHDGYRRLRDPVLHRRAWHYNGRDRSLTVDDEVSCAGTHEVEMYWHFAEDCAVELADDGITARSGGVTLRMQLPHGPEYKLSRGQETPPLGWVSPRFDERRPTTVASASFRIDGSRRIRTRIVTEFAR